MLKTSVILLSAILCSVAEPEPGIIEDMLEAAMGETIPYFVIDVGAEESVVERAEKQEREGLSLTLENAMLRLYIINSELDSANLRHTTKELDRVIRSLKVVQQKVREKQQAPFPLGLASNPDFDVTYLYEMAPSEDNSPEISTTEVNTEENTGESYIDTTVESLTEEFKDEPSDFDFQKEEEADTNWNKFLSQSVNEYLSKQDFDYVDFESFDT